MTDARQPGRQKFPPIVFGSPAPCLCGVVDEPGSLKGHPCWVTPDDAVRIMRARAALQEVSGRAA